MRCPATQRSGKLDEQALNHFFAAQERRAYLMARLALNDPEEAFDVVQDAMLKLVQHYRKRDAAEWPKLFRRILQNCINDRFRRRLLASRLFSFFRERESLDDIIRDLPDTHVPEPSENLTNAELGEALQTAILSLPERQRQVFLLRAWEGCSVKETAALTGCAEGSVKSHYARAQKQLRQQLEQFQ